MVHLLSKDFKPAKDVAIVQDEISFYRHWHAQSETYAGGDSLATALYLGWKLGNKVLLHEHWCAGKRCVRVYYFELIYEEDLIIMPVITNPFVEQLIIAYELQVIPLVSHLGIEKSPSTVEKLSTK
jgi:hypothetical protein